MTITYVDVRPELRTFDNHCRAEREYDRMRELCGRLNEVLALHGVHASKGQPEITMSGDGWSSRLDLHSQVALNLTPGDAALLFEILRDAARKDPYR